MAGNCGKKRNFIGWWPGKIYVEGRLQTRTFTGSDNAQHTITEIVIDDMILLDSKFAGQGAAPVVPKVEGPVVPETPVEVTPVTKEPKKTRSKKKKEEEKPAEEVKEDVNIDDIPF